MYRIGFDSDQYVEMQSRHIAQRRSEFGGKLYLEFGGKLIDDMHASRVLPGFTPDNKVRMLRELADEVEIIVAVNAKDFARRKVRADVGTTYDDEVLRQIDEFRERGLYVGSVVITQWTDDNKAAAEVKERFEKLGIRVYRHFPIPGYPSDVERIVSDEGYGANEYVETSRNLVVVTAPGPGSGKMATCLSHLYHDHKRGIESGYAKWETFPIWNIPLDHPVNVAYEAATADLDDVNMIDPFHLEAYGIKTVNYNRDVEIFPVLSRLFEKILGSSPYKSPTDMGVNMAGHCIVDDEACREASRQEIIRRYYKALVAEKKEMSEPIQSRRISLLMSRVGVGRMDRPVVRPALELAEATGQPAAAMERVRRRRCWAAPRRGCSTRSRGSRACPMRSGSSHPSRSSRSSASRPTTWVHATRACTPTRSSSPWPCPPTATITHAAPWTSWAACAAATSTSPSSSAPSTRVSSAPSISRSRPSPCTRRSRCTARSNRLPEAGVSFAFARGRPRPRREPPFVVGATRGGGRR